MHWVFIKNAPFHDLYQEKGRFLLCAITAFKHSTCFCRLSCVFVNYIRGEELEFNISLFLEMQNTLVAASPELQKRGVERLFEFPVHQYVDIC